MVRLLVWDSALVFSPELFWSVGIVRVRGLNSGILECRIVGAGGFADILRGGGNGGGLRHKGAAQPGQFLIGEKYAQALFDGFAVAVAQGIDVVPAVIVKSIGKQRCTHYESHLLARHTGLELVDLFLGDDVALIHIESVNPGEFPVRTARK